MGQIFSLPDHLLIDLGVRTIGARLRLRPAAGQWVQSQVVCLFSISKTFVQSLFFCFLFLILFQKSGRGAEADVEPGDVDFCYQLLSLWKINSLIVI